MSKSKANNTLVELEMQDGTTVKLTLAYRYLLQLSSYNRKVYDEYNAVFSKKQSKREELDNVRICYAAYLCACLQQGTEKESMSWDEFLDNVTFDREAMGNALAKLLAPKRAGATAMRLA